MGASTAHAVRPQPEMSGMRAPAAAQASCAPNPGETVGARTGSAVVLVNAFVRQPEEQSGNTTVTVCLKPSGRRVLVSTIEALDLCGSSGCEPTPSIILPRSSDRWSAFVINFINNDDIAVVIDTHSGRFQRFDTQPGACTRRSPRGDRRQPGGHALPTWE